MEYSNANSELDRRYALESVGVLQSWDNVDDVFSGLVEAAYRDYFNTQSRFILKDLKSASLVLKDSKRPYYQWIEDKTVLAEVARQSKAETLVRTKVFKEGPNYRFTVDWLLSPRMEQLASVSQTVSQTVSSTSGGDGTGSPSLSSERVRKTVYDVMDQLISKIPFKGNITGIDGQWLTLNIGRDHSVHKNDVVVLGTLEDVKKHPLLSSIVEWSVIETGRAQVTQVDDKISFAKVTDLNPGKSIEPYQKVTKILPPAQGDAAMGEGSIGPDGKYQSGSQNQKGEAQDPARLGWAMAGLWLGSFSRTYSNTSDSKELGGLLVGAKVDSQLWFTRDYFAELQYGYGMFSGGHLTRFQFDIGYNYFMSGSFFGPKGFIRMGYHTTNTDLTVSTADLTGPLSVGAVFLGFGGELPIRGQWRAVMNFDIGLLKSATETGLNSGTDNGITDVTVFLGAIYEWKPKMELRFGVDLIQNGVDFSSGATVSHRVVSFGPSLVAYF